MFKHPLLLGLLGLYIAQGIPFGIAMLALPGIFRDQGSSMTEIGLLALVMLPWGIKFLWANLVDRWRLPLLSRPEESHYLSWVRCCQWLSTAGIAALFFLDPIQNFSWLLLLLVAVTLVHTTQDIAVDALAVLISRANKQANLNVNGVQVGGFSFGMLIGGSGAILIFDSYGWSGMVLYLLLMLWVVYIPFYLFQHSWQKLPDHGPTLTTNKTGLWQALKREAGWKILLVAILFKFGGGMGEALIAPLLIDQQVPLVWLSFITGSAMILTISLGAYIATVIGHNFPLKHLASFSLGIAAICWLILGGYLQVGNSPEVTTCLMITEWLATNVACVAFFGLFMRWCRDEQAGTDFTLLQCHEAVGGVIGMSVGSQLAAVIGFSEVFLISGCAGLLISSLIFWLLSEPRLDVAEDSPLTVAEPVTES